MNLMWNKKSVKTEKIDSKIVSKSMGKNMKKLSGDGLTLYLETNERDIEVIGDGCKLTVIVNSGKIRIHGDGCRLKIQKNSGHIEYRGDGGRVSLGDESTLKKIDYIGEGGKIDIGKEKNHARESYVTADNNKNGGSLAASPKKKFLSSDPSRKSKKNYHSIDQNLNNKSPIAFDDKKISFNCLTKKKAFDDFANEFLKSRNIDANLDGNKREPEQSVRTTIKTVRIFYDDKNYRTPTKTSK